MVYGGVPKFRGAYAGDSVSLCVIHGSTTFCFQQRLYLRANAAALECARSGLFASNPTCE